MNHLQDCRTETLYEAIDHVFRQYALAGFHISHLRVDPEFYPLLAPLADELNCHIDQIPAQAHVPQAERNNRTLKERIRCMYAAMPYNRLCKTLVKYMTFEAASKLNYFPVQGGIPGYSPRSIMGLPTIDYKKHLKATIGSYVQAHHTPKRSNTNELRTLDCIYLRPKYNQLTESHEFLHLATNKIITRAHFTEVPIPQAVIDRVHAIARSEKMPKGLKVQSQIDPDHDPAEVDYDNEEDEEDNTEDEEEEEEDEDDEEDDEDDEVEQNENPLDEDMDNDENIARITGTAPGQFAEVPDDNENEEPVIKQEPIERPLQRSPRLAELAVKKTSQINERIIQICNMQVESATGTNYDTIPNYHGPWADAMQELNIPPEQIIGEIPKQTTLMYFFRTRYDDEIDPSDLNKDTITHGVFGKPIYTGRLHNSKSYNPRDMLSPWYDTLSVTTNDKLYGDLCEPEGNIEEAIKFANDMKACISSEVAKASMEQCSRNK